MELQWRSPFDGMHAHLREIGFEEIPCNCGPLWTGVAHANDGIEKVLQFDFVNCPLQCPVKARHPDCVAERMHRQANPFSYAHLVVFFTLHTAYLHIHLASATSSPEFELRVLGPAQSLWIRMQCMYDGILDWCDEYSHSIKQLTIMTFSRSIFDSSLHVNTYIQPA